MSDITLTEQTVSRLRKMISEKGSYLPGSKLPNENDLSRQLGISRTTLREAIHILATEGHLNVIRGKGTFVSDRLDQTAESNLALQSFADKKITLRDLYEARMIFEPAAAALACRRASVEEINEILRLGDICQSYVLSSPVSDSRVESESAFHGAILKASHNEFLSRFLPLLTETIAKTFELNYNLDVIAEDAYKDHIMIMNFLKMRDEEGLRSAVLIHLHHAVLTEGLNEDT